MRINRLKRREFIAFLGGAAAWPLSARAQQTGKIARIGYLDLNSGPIPVTEGFQSGLRELGYVEGQNLIMLYRWAAGRTDRLGDWVSELLQLKIDIFVSASTEAIMAMQTATKTIPIVMLGTSDPIGNNLVASFARPGGNTTGVTLFANELAGKRLELLKEVVPRLARVALLAEQDHPPTASLVEQTQAATQATRLDLQVFEVRPEKIVDAFASISKGHADAIIVQQSSSFNAYVRQIADLAISYHLPTVHPTRTFVEVGGLMAYGPSRFALGRRAAWYVDRILKGTNPADLPIEQPTKFELVINLKTARALGLTIPQTLLVAADDLIE
jgi:putative ABC transport system substrate-binding protein